MNGIKIRYQGDDAAYAAWQKRNVLYNEVYVWGDGGKEQGAEAVKLLENNNIPFEF